MGLFLILVEIEYSVLRDKKILLVNNISRRRKPIFKYYKLKNFTFKIKNYYIIFFMKN